ncbi:MAG: hypothetical protein PHF20_01380 [Halothiobacillaceae bacterium]|nr:hypothetical protein [Halothiobacillaceae bacterium]
MAKNKEFKLGAVCVTVHTVDGEENLEDWNPRDAAEAKEYAEETSCCGDVKFVVFEDVRKNEHLVFNNPKHAEQSAA